MKQIDFAKGQIKKKILLATSELKVEFGLLIRNATHLPTDKSSYHENGSLICSTKSSLSHSFHF